MSAIISIETQGVKVLLTVEVNLRVERRLLETNSYGNWKKNFDASEDLTRNNILRLLQY